MRRSSTSSPRAVPKCSSSCYCCWSSPSCPLLLVSSALILSTFLAQMSVEGSIHGWRTKRQVNVTSAGNVKGTGDKTEMSAANNMWKQENGVIGANGSSMGNSMGAGSSGLVSGSNAVVGGQKVESVGASSANGTMTKSSGNSSSSINGNGQTAQNLAEGAASGKGNTQVSAGGAASLTNGSQSSPYSGRNTFGEAGASGSQMSYSQVSVGQTLSWYQIMASLKAISISKGENNSQANVALRGGGPGNSLAIDGLVSGVNDKGGGSSFSEVVGSGNLQNRSASMNAGLLGAVNATSGGSKLVGASGLSSNGTNNPSSLNSFGDLRLNGTGQSMGGMLSNASVNPDGTVRGTVGIQGMGNGANKSISVNDGIRAVDGAGGVPVAAIGQGNVAGTGNQAANGSSYVVSNYQTGQGSNLLVGSQGQSKAQNGTMSDLQINNKGNFLNGSQITNASSNAVGKVTGQNSVVDGKAIMALGQQQSGNSSIIATGGGKGPSSALTDTNLSLAGPGGTPRNSAVKGTVDANGDQTYVQSVSNLSDRNGLQSLFNSQNATVQSQGSAQAQASNAAVLKKRRRRRRAVHRQLRELAKMVEGR